MRSFILFMLLISFVRCESESHLVYEDEERWIPVVADLYVAQVAVEASEKDLQDSLFMVYRDQIMDLHNVRQEELAIVLDAIAEDPQRAVSFYDKVIEYVNKIDQEREHNTEE